MGDVVGVFDRAADEAGADVFGEFGDEDAVAGGGVREAEGGGAVDVVVFVEAEAEDGGCEEGRYADGGVGDLWVRR